MAYRSRSNSPRTITAKFAGNLGLGAAVRHV